MEPGAIGGGAGPKEVKCFSQNVLTHDQETTRLVKTFPSLSSMIKRGAGSSAAKREPLPHTAMWHPAGRRETDIERWLCHSAYTGFKDRQGQHVAIKAKSESPLWEGRWH